MTSPAFRTEVSERDNLLIGPWRSPKQMLHAQVYDSHASIHDDATAQKLGFQGGTIEGPTHLASSRRCASGSGARPGSRPDACRRITATPPSRVRRCRPISKGRSRARRLAGSA